MAFDDTSLDAILEKANIQPELGVFCGIDLINFDFINSQIVIPFGIVASKNTYYSTWAPVTLDMAPATPPSTERSLCALWFDPDTTAYSTSQANLWDDNNVANTRLILLAAYWYEAQKVHGPSAPYKINGALPGAVPNFAELTHRLILPDKIYLLTGRTLPLYKSSIYPYCSSIENFKTCIVDTGGENTSPKYKYFYEDIDLDPAVLPESFKIAIKTNASTAPNYYNYYKTITKVVTDPSTKTAATPKIMHIGDSLTNLEVPYHIKYKLNALSISATMVGTYTNDGNEKGEGRGGWMYRHFIGQSNVLYGTTIVPCTLQPTENPSYYNPFIRLATADDKTNHPTWCYRNTGAENELNYQEDEVKTGDFYIFDFANYLTNNPTVSTPDIITIALSTNDILRGLDIVTVHDSVVKTPQQVIDMCLHGLEIMLTSIHAACPSAKIGIVPAPVVGSSDWGNTMWTTVVAWIEACITYVNSLNASSYLSIIPVWCHMDNSWNWAYSATANLSSTNTEVKATRSELIHWLKPGIHQYTDALLAYVVSQL